jgi:Secretion system C-terminal sorting domain
MTKTFIISLFFASAFALQAQSPISATLNTNRVEATVINDGRFFTDGTTGKFLVPYKNGTTTLMRSAGLWIGGLDANGKLRIAATNEKNSDFKPGLWGTGQLANKIWRVTADQIEAHKADFADNQKIDNPISAIFAWPGQDNSFFPQYNDGAQIPFSSTGLAEFFDADDDGLYNPAKGDYPAAFMRGCPVLNFQEMLWYVFHNKNTATNPVGGTQGLNIEVRATIFANKCAENSPFGNSVFTQLKILNTENTPLEKAYFGLYNDFQVGDGSDEFVGCDSLRYLSFAYAGDPKNADLPSICVDLLRGPLSQDPDPLIGVYETPISSIKAFDAKDLVSSSAFYSILTGKNTDGSSSNDGGFSFPDNPLNINGVSEITLGNQPGDRAAVTSYGPLGLQPFALNEMVFTHSFADNGQPNILAKNIPKNYFLSDLLQSYFDNCFNALPGEDYCDPRLLPAHEPELAHLYKVYPTPATDHLWTESEVSDIQSITIFDALGRLTLTQNYDLPQKKQQVPMAALPKGLYFVQVKNTEQQMIMLKLIKE